MSGIAWKRLGMKINWRKTFFNSIPLIFLIGGILLGYDQRKWEEKNNGACEKIEVGKK